MAQKVRELTELRTRFSKHWLRDDGLFEARFTRYPMHYQDKDGIFKEISPVPKDRQVQHRGKAFHYGVEGPYDFLFSKWANGPFRYLHDGCIVSWTFKEAEKRKGTISDDDVKYLEVYPGIDVRIAFRPEGVKEEIIVNRLEVERLTIILEAEGCSPRLYEDGHIDWERDDNGEIVSVSVPPVVPVSKGLNFGDYENFVVSHSLAQVGDHKWEYTLILNEQWLKFADLPIVIDPSQQITTMALDGYCTWSGGDSGCSVGSSGNYGAAYLRTGQQTNCGDPDCCTWKYSPLVKFSLSSLPGGIFISNATLNLYKTAHDQDPTGHSMVLYGNLSDFDSSTHYNTKPGVTSPQSSYTENSSVNVWRTLTVGSSVATGWLTNNYGMQLFSYGLVYFASSEHATVNLRPYLDVVYAYPPDAPSGLTPGGPGAGSSSHINSLTPRLSWTYSDPGSNPQGSFQIEIRRTSDNVLVHDSGEVSSTNTYYDVPSSALSAGTAYYWKVRAKNNVTGCTWGNYSSAVYIYTNQAPTVSGLTPGGAVGNPENINTITPQLGWTYNDLDGDAQASFQVLIYRSSDDVLIRDSGEVVTVNPYYDVPAATMVEGVGYYWKVRVKDIYGYWGLYSSAVYVYTNIKPVATPVSPAGTDPAPGIVANTLTPVLDWTYSDGDGHPQAGFQVIIKQGAVIVRDSGEVVSGDSQYNVLAGDLTYGVEYNWSVRVKDSQGGWSAYTTSQYFVCNQTAGKPTNPSPSGTSIDPYEVITLQPVVAWTHSDPDSDPQAGFQVRIHRANDNLVIHDSGDVVSGVSQYEVPTDVLILSTKYWWEVRTKDAGSGQYGPYSDVAYIYTNAAPLAPTSLIPVNGTVFDATQDKTFTWTFQDPDIATNGDSQTAFQLQVKQLSDGMVIYDSGKVIGGTASHTVPGGSLTNGLDYQWQVKTWDGLDQPGPYSGLVYIRTGTPPSVGITEPLNSGTYPKGILTVKWSYSDPELDPQDRYRAVLKNHLGATLEDSGEVGGEDTQHTFTAVLQNGVMYIVEVTIGDVTEMSSTDTSTFTTNFTSPTDPLISVIGDSVGAKVIIIIANPDNDPEKPVTARNDLYRREGTGEWVRIAAGLPLNVGYDDYAVTTGIQVEYKAVAISDVETTIESTVLGTAITYKGVWLHDVIDPDGTVHHFRWDGQARSTSWQSEGTSMQFAGRKKPVFEFGEAEDGKITFTLQMLQGDSDHEALQSLARRKGTLCYRDGRGRKMFGVVKKLPVVDDRSVGYTATVELSETDYTEEV